MNTQCNLCSKISPPRLVQIKKCAHTFCTICILTYLKQRKFCPVCIPYKKRKKFHFLTYLHPFKLIKKIKKYNKKISTKHLKPLFDELKDDVQNEILGEEEVLISRSKFNPITVEKDVQQTKASNESDMNNNVNRNVDYNRFDDNVNKNLNTNRSNESNDQDKYSRIKELILKNENLKQFIEKINKLQHTMSSLHNLNELNKLIDELTEHQSELKSESKILTQQVHVLRDLNDCFERLMHDKTRQNSLLDQAESINVQFDQTVHEYRMQNLELRQNYTNLLNHLDRKLIQQ